MILVEGVRVRVEALSSGVLIRQWDITDAELTPDPELDSAQLAVVLRRGRSCRSPTSSRRSSTWH